MLIYLSLIDDERERRLFEKIYNTYRQQMFCLARSILSSDADAEDAIHEVFIRVATKHMKLMGELKNENDIRNYLLKATKNTAINIINKRKHENVSVDSISESAQLHGATLSDSDFIDAVCTQYDYEKVVYAIKRLDKKYSDVLYYHFVLEMSVRETADLLGRNASTVKKQLVRGKKLLLSMTDFNGGMQNGNE